MFIFNSLSYFTCEPLRTDELYAQHRDGTIGVTPDLTLRSAIRDDRPSVSKMLASLNTADFSRFLFWSYRDLMHTANDLAGASCSAKAIDFIASADIDEIRRRVCDDTIARHRNHHPAPGSAILMHGVPAGSDNDWKLTGALAYLQSPAGGMIRAYSTPSLVLVGRNQNVWGISSVTLRPGNRTSLDELEFVVEFDPDENAKEWHDRIKAALDADAQQERAKALREFHRNQRIGAIKAFMAGDDLTEKQRKIIKAYLDGEEVEV